MKTPDSPTGVPFACVLNSWRGHEAELRGYLMHRVADPYLTEDLVQDVFLKAIRYGSRFCKLDNPRAWLFQVARNALVDTLRLHKDAIPLPDDLALEEEQIAPVDALSECLAKTLSELSDEDGDILRRCDLEGVKQQDYADLHGLSLAAVKSRLLRARKRLRQRMIRDCGVRFDDSGAVCCHLPRPVL